MEARLGIEQQQSATQGQEAEATDNEENPGGIGGMVIGLMESGGGRASIKGIIHALTLERKVPDSLYKYITDELRAMQDRGEIVEVKSGKYSLPGEEEEEGAQPDALPAKTNGQPRRKKLKDKDRARLDRMMHQAFGRVGIKPKMGRKNQVNPRRKHRPHPTRKRY